MPTETIAVSDFKARCLRLLEEIAASGEPLVVTKRGKPLVKVVPLPLEAKPLKGRWAGMGKSTEDIVHFNVADDWESAR